MGMIKTFRCKDTEKLFNDLRVKRFRNISRAARIKLEMLNAAVSLQSLRVPPGNRLEQLKGGRSGQHSIRINDQWRICFVWQGENAIAVEIVDYHKG
jgi:proteic killer suppression protein